jgi:hypothetical protein
VATFAVSGYLPAYSGYLTKQFFWRETFTLFDSALDPRGAHLVWDAGPAPANWVRIPFCHLFVLYKEGRGTAKVRIEALQAELAKLEAVAGGHRADFERERDRADRLMDALG